MSAHHVVNGLLTAYHHHCLDALPLAASQQSNNQLPNRFRCNLSSNTHPPTHQAAYLSIRKPVECTLLVNI